MGNTISKIQVCHLELPFFPVEILFGCHSEMGKSKIYYDENYGYTRYVKARPRAGDLTRFDGRTLDSWEDMEYGLSRHF